MQVAMFLAVLLLERYQDPDAQADYLPVELSDGSVKLGSERHAPPLPVPGWPGHFHAVAAHDRGVWAVAERAAGGYQVVVHDRDPARAVATVALDRGVVPVALHLTEDGLFVGATQGRLLYAKLGAGTAETLVEREHAFKSYDLFARAGDRLLAVDDLVRPLFGDWYQIGGGATPRRLADFEMPSLINGVYTNVVVTPTSGGHAVYLVGRYALRDGWGHELVRLPIEGNKLAVPRSVLNDGRGTMGKDAVEEHVKRSTGKPEKLAAGSEYTDFSGLAVDPAAGKLLVAAGTRGLLIFPLDLGRPEVMDTKGACHDVVVLDGRPVALVEEGGKGVLLLVGWERGKAVARARHPLPAVYQRFVQ